MDETALAIQTNNQKTPVTIGVRGIQINSLDELWRFSRAVAASPFVSKGLETPEAIMVAIEYGLEVGLTPMAALQNVMVVNGRPALYGDAMLAVVVASGLLEDFFEDFEGTPYEDSYRAVCVSKRHGRSQPLITYFSVADAKRAGLWNKSSGPWKEYPERMLRFRARGFNLRDNFADVLRGLISKEEAEDIPSGSPPSQFGPQAVTVDTSTTPPRVIPPAEVHPTLEQVNGLVAQATSCGVDLAGLGQYLRPLMQLSGEIKVTKKFLREQMTMQQYEVAWQYYTNLLKQQVEDEEDVPLHDAPNAPVDETSPTANTIEAAAEQNDSTGQPGASTTPAAPSITLPDETVYVLGQPTPTPEIDDDDKEVTVEWMQVLRQWAERLGTQAKLNEILQQYPAMHLRQYAEAWVAVERHRKVGQA